MKEVFKDEKARIFCVYRHTVPDGRYYIGFTHNTQDRWGRGANYVRAPLFYPLIQKYGWDAIKHEVLIAGLTLKEACAEEKRLIKEAQDNGLSLNVSRGGLGGGVPGLSHGPRTDVVKRKISEHNKGKKHTEEHINKFRKSCKWRFRPVKVCKDGAIVGEFENVNCAAKSLHVPKENIYQCLKRKKTYTTHGYTFEVIVQSEQGTNKCPRMKYYKPTSNVRRGKDSARSKRVTQYTKDGTFIMEWDCISDAVRMLGVSGPGISECIKGTHKTAGGYIWKVIN